MRLLLINPRFQESFWSFKLAVDKILPSKRTINPPLGLATLAALCPENWEVEIIDENIESIPLAPQVDIVGVCGMGVQFERQKELLTFYRKKGYFVVAGGSFASLCPELFESFADTVIAGEAEYIWKEFCKDIEEGTQKKLYLETGTVDLKDSPVPKFQLLKADKYQTMNLQFSRGCPFNCEFCDIIVMFGRKPRTKSMQQIGKELDSMRQLNVKRVFFVDDNFIGNKRVAKDLLKFLVEYQKTHNYRFQFGTEVSINMAYDDKLLELFREAGFEWVFIGIESPDEASLKETGKFQNTLQDLLSSVRKIYSYGVEIFAGFIIGFDNDTMETFEKQFDFIMKSGIQTAMIGLLTALPKTPLYERLEKENRLICDANNADNTKMGTNIIPKQMGYDEMVNGYRRLHYRLLEYKNIAERIKNKTRYVGAPVDKIKYSFKDQLTILKNLFAYGLLPGGFSCLFHFFRSIPFFSLRHVQTVVTDWITGLAMRDYANRHFVQEVEANRLMSHYIGVMEKVFQRYLNQGALEVSLNQVKNATSNLSIFIKGWVDKDFFIPATEQLYGLLKNTTSSVTFHIEEFNETRIKYLNRLLQRLSPFGDRIYISVSEKLRTIIDIDSSIFHLVLEREI